MKHTIFIPVVFLLFNLSACIHTLHMHSQDGEKLSGQYRFAREDTGLIQVNGSNGELLKGQFVRVGRTKFVERFEKAFGRGTVAFDGPDLSAYGNAFGGFFGTSSTLVDSAHGKTFNNASGTVVKGPLVYWIASLGGDRGTTMACFIIGSSHAGHALGKCKSNTEKEYTLEF
jgi:hypothetical protein